MILRRILYFMAGASALAVSAGIVMVALAYAEYALVKPPLGPAGASGVVALTAAVMIGVIGFILTMLAKPPKPKKHDEASEGLVDRVIDFVRARPITAIGAALAAGLLVVRNPSYLGAAVRSFLDGVDAEPRRRRRTRK